MFQVYTRPMQDSHIWDAKPWITASIPSLNPMTRAVTAIIVIRIIIIRRITIAG